MVAFSEVVARLTNRGGHAAPAVGERDRLHQALQRYVLDRDPEYQRYRYRGGALNGKSQLLDYLFAGPDETPSALDAFGRLRWGGQFVYVGREEAQVRRVAESFTGERGFAMDVEPRAFRAGNLVMRILGLAPRLHYFAARKVLLIPPGQSTDRFTYHVELVRNPDSPGEYIVLKQVPDYDHVVRRLRERFPDAGAEIIEKRAHKLVDSVFPVFLTREAGFLHILQRDLPEPYRQRVPRVIKTEKDSRGFVRTLYLNWLRNGGEPISQLQFALQSADLLRALHEQARVLHLDLRLDNFVITPDGVGFVDFGSAVRVGENLAESKMLTALFDEMMWTSESQRRLSKLHRSGQVTSAVMSCGVNKVDKAVDLFCLSVQMTEPHSHPDLKDLVEYQPSGSQAQALANLAQEILKPNNPHDPPYQSAADILEGVRRIKHDLGRSNGSSPTAGGAHEHEHPAAEPENEGAPR